MIEVLLPGLPSTQAQPKKPELPDLHSHRQLKYHVLHPLDIPLWTPEQEMAIWASIECMILCSYTFDLIEEELKHLNLLRPYQRKCVEKFRGAYALWHKKIFSQWKDLDTFIHNAITGKELNYINYIQNFGYIHASSLKCDKARLFSLQFTALELASMHLVFLKEYQVAYADKFSAINVATGIQTCLDGIGYEAEEKLFFDEEHCPGLGTLRQSFLRVLANQVKDSWSDYNTQYRKNITHYN